MSNLMSEYIEAEKLKDDGKLDDAIAKLQEVLAVDGSFVIAHSALAVLYGKVNQHELAIEHAKQVCELEPNDAFSFTALSVTYQRAYAGTDNHAYIQMAEDAMAQSQHVQQLAI